MGSKTISGVLLIDIYRRTPESHLKGVFRRSIFLIRTFFQNFIRILGDTPKFSVLIRTQTHTSKKFFFDISASKIPPNRHSGLHHLF